MQRPAVPTLSRKYRKQWTTAAHGLHSLRVAGVSRLLDAGLPLAVVASIAGHRSLAMTLHYYRAERGELRLKLKEAYQKLGSNEFLAEIERNLQRVETHEQWLKGSSDAFAALKRARKTKLWTVSLSGICPGASCDAGLPKEFLLTHGADVPGSRCALCRFRIYGTPFLPGLIHEYNCLLFELEQRANRQHELRCQAEAAEDRGEYHQAQMARGEDELLERESQLDLKVLARLHTMIAECLRLLNDGQSSPGKFALVTDEPDQLRARVEAVGRLSQLKSLVESGELLPAARQTAPDQALRLLQEKLLQMLRTNGAPCFFAGLPGPLAKRLTLQLAELIEAVVPDVDTRERLIEGDALLSQVSIRGQTIEDHIRVVNEKLRDSKNRPEIVGLASHPPLPPMPSTAPTKHL